MALVEVGLWLMIGVMLGVLATLLPHDPAHAFRLVVGGAVFAWVGGTLGKFVITTRTNVEAEFSWISLVLAPAATLVYVWFETVINHPRPHADEPKDQPHG